MSKWVVNISSRKLSNAEQEVLHLGLNLAPAPSRLPLINTVAAIEVVSKLENDAAYDLQGRISGIIRRAKLPMDNLSKEHRKVLKSMKKMEDVVVLPADKGNTTVVMNKKDYCMKIEGMLAFDNYNILKKDPT